MVGNERFQVGTWIVNPGENRLTDAREQSCHISPKAMEVLVCLAGKAGEVLSKDELLTSVWGTRFVSEGVLTNAILELRNAFNDDARQPAYIETITKRGYRLVAPVSPVIRQAWKTVFARFGRVGLGGIALVLVLGAVILWSETSHTAEPTRLAVLSFDDLSPQPGHLAFAHGMTELLVNELTAIKKLQVISGQGLEHLDDSGLLDDPHAIAQKLGAQLLLKGSVLLVNSHVRVTTHLVDGSDGVELWAGTFESSLGDVPNLQRDVARAVTQEIQIRLSPNEESRLSEDRNVTPAALLEYTEGVHFYDQWDSGSLNRSATHFERAIELDPQFAPARARLARSLVALAMVEAITPAYAYPRALRAATVAVRLDDHQAADYAALALVRLALEWDKKGAEKAALKAVQLNPSSVFAYQTLSLVYMAEGRNNDNIKAMLRAHTLAPLSYYTNLRLGWSYYMASHYRDSIKVLQNTLELYSNKKVAHVFLARDYAMLGQKNKAMTECKLGAYPCAWVRAHLGFVDGTERQRYSLKNFVASRHRPDHVRLAGALAELGDYDEAFQHLRQLVKEGSPDAIFIAHFPFLQRLHSDPRWAALLKEISEGSPLRSRKSNLTDR